jgi:hypothetical protein
LREAQFRCTAAAIRQWKRDQMLAKRIAPNDDGTRRRERSASDLASFLYRALKLVAIFDALSMGWREKVAAEFQRNESGI